jgi:hypothetical protein
VPPKTVDKVVEAETTPLMAWSEPVSVPMYRLPETVRAVEEAKEVTRRLVFKFVLVAFVEVELTITKLVIVEVGALTITPPVKDKRVEVELPGKA